MESSFFSDISERAIQIKWLDSSESPGTSLCYGIHPTPFGDCFIVMNGAGICRLGFVQESAAEVFEDFEKVFPKAVIREDHALTGTVLESVFGERSDRNSFSLCLKGTPFQRRVWEALLRIPFGTLVSYRDVAGIAGHPTAIRAVASAVGANPVAYLIPCHRVIRAEGTLGQYRWGASRKAAMIAWETAHV